MRALTDVFVAGGFGQTILSDVSVLQKTDADDCYLIDDGLATVTALSQLLTLYNKAVDDADNDFQWPHNLVERERHPRKFRGLRAGGRLAPSLVEREQT